MALPFQYIEDVPAHLQSQPDLDPLVCYECIRRYGNALIPAASNDMLVPKQACSTSRNAAGQCDKCSTRKARCTPAKDKIPPQFRRAANMLLELRKALDTRDELQHEHRTERQVQRLQVFTRQFASYGAALNRALDAHAAARAEFASAHGEAAVRRDDERKLRMYLHNFDRAMLGIGPIGDPEPTNVVIDRQIEVEFLLQASDEDAREKFYGAQTTLPIRGFMSRAEMERATSP